jgi:hypothetical protein
MNASLLGFAGGLGKKARDHLLDFLAFAFRALRLVLVVLLHPQHLDEAMAALLAPIFVGGHDVLLSVQG